jgi:hypothetical protein
MTPKFKETIAAALTMVFVNIGIAEPFEIIHQFLSASGAAHFGEPNLIRLLIQNPFSVCFSHLSPA